MIDDDLEKRRGQDTGRTGLESGMVGVESIEVARLVDSDLTEDAIGILGDIPDFNSEDGVRRYLNGKTQEYRQSEGLGREGPVRQSKAILATLYEKLASAPSEEIAAFARMQSIRCERRLSDLKERLDLLRPSIDVIERVRNLASLPHAATVFNAGFLKEAGGPIFVDKVLGPDFQEAVSGKADVLDRQLKSVTKAQKK